MRDGHIIPILRVMHHEGELIPHAKQGQLLPRLYRFVLMYWLPRVKQLSSENGL